METIRDRVARSFRDDDDALARLLAFHQSIAAQERQGLTDPRRPGNKRPAGTRLTTSRIGAAITL